MTRLMSVMALAVIAAAGVCLAQDAGPAAAAPGKFFKMDFVIREVDGARTINSRSYSMMVPAGSHKFSQVRAGNKVEVNRHVVKSSTGGEQATGDFVDVGVSIDVQDATEMASGIAFSGRLEVSSIPSGFSPQDSPGVIRQNSFASTFAVPLNKRTVIISSDNLDSKSTLQVEVSVSQVM